MSAGKFTIDGKYEDEKGNIYPCRYQPETATATIDGEQNQPPAGAITSDISVRLTTGARQFGITPRKVKLKFTGTKPTGYDGETVVIPVLSKFWFALLTKGATGTYLGAPVKVLQTYSERVK